jgi:thiol-disulfide isomerase/thioredoxin
MESKLITESDTTYVINFWATWCKPCVAELPYFEELNASEDFDKPMKVILISLDDKKVLNRKVIPLLEKKNIRSEVWLLDDAKYNDWIDKVSTDWSGAIPATLIFNKNKRQFEEADFSTYSELKNIISQFLEG